MLRHSYNEEGPEMKRLALAFLAVLAAAVPAVAQEMQVVLDGAGAGCTGGIKSDDGSFEAGYGFTTATTRGSYVMRFTLPGGSNRIDAICIAWARTGGDSSVTYDINIWAADGAGGSPGTLLMQIPNKVASAVGGGPSFYRTDIPGGVTVNTSTVYIGPSWAPNVDVAFVVGADQSGPGGQPGYQNASAVGADNPPQGQLGQPGKFPSYKALGVRVEAAATGPITNCVPDGDTLCIDDAPGDHRFKVEIQFHTSQSGGISGAGHAVSLADKGITAGGLFWFFSPTNPELLVKVLNGCAIGGYYWVFFSAGTNVGLTLTVTDTQTGNTFVRSNPDLTPVPTVQATNALPCS
jgi:hypothetical protein